MMEAGVVVLPCVDVSNCLHATKFVCDITNYITIYACNGILTCNGNVANAGNCKTRVEIVYTPTYFII